jgi:hypothetical protein
MLNTPFSREQGLSIYKLIQNMPVGMYMSIGITTVVIGVPDDHTAAEVCGRLHNQGWKVSVYRSRLSPGQYQIIVPLAY